MSEIYGIVGDPVEHSRSPAMQMAAFGALGIDAEYRLFHFTTHQLERGIQHLRAIGVAGFNVTVPHKQTILALLDEVRPTAQAIGAVNTVVRIGERLVGHNTDAVGLVGSLREHGIEISGGNVVVLGAGGAARAAVVGLLEAGARTVVVAARRSESARSLVGAMKATHVIAVTWSDLRVCFADTSLVIQATSATLGDTPVARDFAQSLPLDALPLSATVLDVVYEPRLTTVLRAARDRGLATIDGLGMLIHQGARAFELWTGRAAPLDVMRIALEDSLSASSALS